jgi:Rrf2 family protein
MKVSLKVEYACRVLAQLARYNGTGEWPHIEDLATKESVPANYLVQILNDLRNSGLIQSRRGKQGGYALAHENDQISLYDIICAMDGGLLEFNTDAKGESGEQVVNVWQNLASAFESETRDITLQDILSTTSQDMYFI